MVVRQPAAPVNRLLASLSSRSSRNFLAGCEQVELDFADVLCNSGQRIRHVYFPTSGFISLVTALDATAKLEVGIVGAEGMLGISLIMGMDVSPQQAMVQGAGSALRMTTATFTHQCQRNPSLRQDLNRYLYVLMSQLAQTAACTHYHRIEARLARWLLMSRDRAHGDRFPLTQEFLAYMLGVRRAGITLAASALQLRGLISYSRGIVVILNRKGLEVASCRCYRAGNDMYEFALGKRRRSVTRSPTD